MLTIQKRARSSKCPSLRDENGTDLSHGNEREEVRAHALSFVCRRPLSSKHYISVANLVNTVHFFSQFRSLFYFTTTREHNSI